MVTKRSAKVKGSSFEYDCQYSLSQLYPEIYRTSERGFQLQYDLECDNAVFECKRLKSLSWNQAKKFYDKLESKAPNGKASFLLFKSNRQPCLVMYNNSAGALTINTFEYVFSVPFLKHPSTRSKK